MGSCRPPRSPSLALMYIMGVRGTAVRSRCVRRRSGAKVQSTLYTETDIAGKSRCRRHLHHQDGAALHNTDSGDDNHIYIYLHKPSLWGLTLRKNKIIINALKQCFLRYCTLKITRYDILGSSPYTFFESSPIDPNPKPLPRSTNVLGLSFAGRTYIYCTVYTTLWLNRSLGW